MTTPLDDVVITIADIQKAGYCVRGVKGWFAERDWDFRDFLKNGMTATAFLAAGDAHSANVVARKLEREARTPNDG